MSSKFSRYVREVEERSSEEDRRELDAARARFRLGSKLLQQRRKAGMTQQQLASLSGVAQGEISRIEHGLSNPTTLTLEAIARPLGRTLDVVPVETVKDAAEV